MGICSTKERERRIINIVYPEGVFDDLREHECPDFLVRYSRESKFFGIEVTEFFDCETSARLRRIGGYVGHLIDGGEYKHKVDRNVLTVGEFDIVRQDGGTHAKGVRGLIRENPSPWECTTGIAARIRQKGEQLSRSTADMTHVNLVIRDHSQPLRLMNGCDLFPMFFVPEMVQAIGETHFREVFVITTVGGDEVVLRLKMLHLLAEAYLFSDFVWGTGVSERIPAECDDVELFAAYFASTVESAVYCRRDTDGIEVIFGDAGIFFDRANGVAIRLHMDQPLGTSAFRPTIDWESALGPEFGEGMTEYRKSHRFETSAFFPVKPSAGT